MTVMVHSLIIIAQFRFYYNDPELGFMHVRLQSWFPFEIQVYLNGREILARQLDKAGIGYERYENSFVSIEDVRKAQKLAEQLNKRRWHKILDVFAMRVNPFLGRITEIFSRGYYWCCSFALFREDEVLISIEKALTFMLASTFPAFFLQEGGKSLWEVYTFLRVLSR